MSESRGESDLLQAARGGDRAALSALVERYQARVYRFSVKICRDSEEARDVAQETLLELLRSVAGFEGRSSLSTWLFAVARSRALRRQRRTIDFGAAADVVWSDQVPPPDELLSKRQIESALADAIEQLAPPYREVMALRDVEGLSAAETAEVLGLSIEAVKSRIHRARLAVRERLLARLSPELDAIAPTPGGPCHEMAQLFTRHVEGELDRAFCDRMERHVEGCRRCQVICDSIKKVLTMCSTQPTPEVPTAIQNALREALRSWTA